MPAPTTEAAPPPADAPAAEQAPPAEAPAADGAADAVPKEEPEAPKGREPASLLKKLALRLDDGTLIKADGAVLRPGAAYEGGRLTEAHLLRAQALLCEVHAKLPEEGPLRSLSLGSKRSADTGFEVRAAAAAAARRHRRWHRSARVGRGPAGRRRPAGWHWGRPEWCTRPEQAAAGPVAPRRAACSRNASPVRTGGSGSLQAVAIAGRRLRQRRGCAGQGGAAAGRAREALPPPPAAPAGRAPWRAARAWARGGPQPPPRRMRAAAAAAASGGAAGLGSSCQ